MAKFLKIPTIKNSKFLLIIVLSSVSSDKASDKYSLIYKKADYLNKIKKIQYL